MHNLALLEGNLYLGTHEGLWMQAPGGGTAQVSRDAFDVMGLTRSADRWFASGHPAEGQDAPGNLGLIESVDDGRTWQPVSLPGEVDFHRLVASGDVLMGLSAHGGALLRSPDAGRSWTSLSDVPLYDLAIDPTDPTVVIGTTQDGPMSSGDGGVNFTPIDGAPLIALLAWNGGTVYGVSPDGTVYASVDAGSTWQVRGEVTGSPTALAAEGEAVALLADQTVYESTDGGRTFQPRLAGLM